jgi:hypothetical protein
MLMEFSQGEISGHSGKSQRDLARKEEATL